MGYRRRCHTAPAGVLPAWFNLEEIRMTLCPIALTAGCKKCPAFSVCPLKGVIGDHKPEQTQSTKSERSGGR